MIAMADAAALALWLDAAADGRAAPDDVVAACGAGPVGGWSGEAGAAMSVVAAHLAKLGRSVEVVLALAVPGDPGPLVGDRELIRTAANAGGAVVLRPLNLALVPLGSGPHAQWSAHAIDSSTVHAPDRVDAERALRRAIRMAVEELDELDLAAGRDRVDPALLDRRRRPIPEDTASDRVALLDLALSIGSVLDAVDLEAGAALSASALAARLDLLRDVRRATRRGAEAAASTPVRPR